MGLNKAKKILKEYIKKGDKIGVAVSGGADSMCLISLILTCDFIDKKDIIIININHNIRGKNSDSDSAFVKAFAQKNSITYNGFSVDVPSVCAATGGSVESVARQERYLIFDQLIGAGAVKFVLLAHHESDNVESVLLHIFRGSGIKGLSGMPILKDNKYLRPLITTPKSEIETYIKELSIEHIVDESNSDNSYNRNYIRNIIMPLIEARFEGAKQSIFNLSIDANDILEFMLSQLDLSKIEKRSDIEVGLETSALSDKVLSAQYIFAALSEIGVCTDIERKHIQDIILMSNGRNGAKLDLPGKLTALKENNKIVFYLSGGENLSNDLSGEKFTELEFNEGEYDSFEVKFSIKKLEITRDEILKNDYKYLNKTLVFNKAKVPNDAIIRLRRDGDRFCPYGGRTKKLKEYFIDKKIVKRERDKLPLICSGSEVLIIIGVEISDKIKAEANRCENNFIVETKV